MEVKSCISCTLPENFPAIKINDEGFCNYCKLQFSDEIWKRKKYAEENYEIFMNYSQDERRKYDCILMLSGGKDSIYMLDNIVNERKLNTLAYTVTNPFESSKAITNIELAVKAIGVDHVEKKYDEMYKKLMRKVFNEIMPNTNFKRFLDDQIPCVTCSHFFQISACVHAYENDIPFILYCADPIQMFTLNSNLKENIELFISRIGKTEANEIFSYDIESLLKKDEAELPRVIFPYVALRSSYSKDKIIAELKERGLYNGSPMETHCQLYGLLNYFSFKYLGCMFYKSLIASQIRSVFNFSGRNSDDSEFKKIKRMFINSEREFSRIVKAVADNNASKEDWNILVKIHKEIMKETESASKYNSDLIFQLNNTAEELGILL